MARPGWSAAISFLLGLLSVLWWRHHQDTRLLEQMDESEQRR